jgi:ADP-ribose pyrophosphatase YjhB (NUDIX family)
MDSSFLTRHTFTNADQEIVPYDGSPVTWRVSVYVLVCRTSEANTPEILIIKNHLEKLHDIVGGGIELGETIEEAIQREALEEAGAQIKLGQLLQIKEDWFYHRKGSFHHTLQLFYAAELMGELQAPTEPDIVWRESVPVSEIGVKYHVPPVVAEVIAKIQS